MAAAVQGCPGCWTPRKGAWAAGHVPGRPPTSRLAAVLTAGGPPPAPGALRRLPMQTIQGEQAGRFPAGQPRSPPRALPALLLPPPAPRPGPVLGAPGELALAGAAGTYPGKGWLPYAPPAPSQQCLAHPISLMTLPGEARRVWRRWDTRPPRGPPGGLLLDALPAAGAAAAGPLARVPDPLPRPT